MTSKFTIWPLLSLLALAAGLRADTAAPPAGPASVAINGDFSRWQDAPAALAQKLDCTQVPTGWFIWPPEKAKAASLARDTQVKHTGDCSLRLGNTDSTSNFALAQRMAVQEETRYVVRIWVRGEKIDDYYPQGLNVLLVPSSSGDLRSADKWAGNLGESYKSPPASRGTFDWCRLVATVDMPQGAKTLMMDIFMHGAGTAWIGEVSVTPLEKCLQVESY
jgi:hypothetical protein